jgi:hypothetical protein
MIWHVKFADRFVTRLVILKDAFAVAVEEFEEFSMAKSSTTQLGILNDLSVQASSGQLEVGASSCPLTNRGRTVLKNKIVGRIKCMLGFGVTNVVRRREYYKAGASKIKPTT